MMGVDPRRFGPYASRGYLKEKNEEAYANVFTTHYPDEEREAARPLKTTPCYDRMKALGAVFGSVDQVLWNQNYSEPLDGGPIVEKNSFRRSNYHEFVGNECKHVTEKVGLLDMSAFAKAIVKGPGAEAWLEYIFANKMPKTIGRISLVHMLTINGGVRSEYTVYKTGPQSFYLVSAGAFETHDHDYLFKLKPKDGSVDVQRVTTNTGVLVLAGPRSREVLQKITDTDLSNDKFKWLTGKKINVGYATAEALRVNFVGELGYELHHPIEMQNYIFDEVMKAGAEFDIKPFGIRAMDSMRLEKSYRLIPREMSIEYSAMESALDRFVRLDKEGDFIGKQALTEWIERGAENACATLEVHGVLDADARGSEAIYKDGEVIGRTTSGGYGWRVGKSLALGMVKPHLAAIGSQVEIEILGEMYQATVIEESPFDPSNEKLRA